MCTNALHLHDDGKPLEFSSPRIASCEHVEWSQSLALPKVGCLPPKSAVVPRAEKGGRNMGRRGSIKGADSSCRRYAIHAQRQVVGGWRLVDLATLLARINERS
jgi:hypothetical protein